MAATADYAAVRLAEVQAPAGKRADVRSVAFLVCCAYVVSQVYMVPLIAIGPSWSVWPTLPDVVAFVAALLVPLVGRNHDEISPWLRTMRRYLMVFTIGACISYVVLTLDPFGIKSGSILTEKGINNGSYQIYRMLQFVSVFWLVTSIAWTPLRRDRMHRVVAITFWVSAAEILLDYIHVINTPAMAPQVPRSLAQAGPWAYYALGTIPFPVGAISYHHAYPSVQLLLLGATYIALMPRQRIWRVALVVGTLLATSFVSGSRAGFIAVFVFAAAVLLSNLRVLFLSAAMLVMAVTGAVLYSTEVTDTLSAAMTRQATIASSYSNDGFAGRIDIWADRIDLLTRTPMFWFTGTGFGSAVQTGSNAHMLFLHITLECGVFALFLFLAFHWKMVRHYWTHGPEQRTMCFGIIALLVSSLTQETIYPVPALGHFCGTFLFCLAIVPSRKTERIEAGQ